MITTTSFPARDSRTDLTDNRLEKALDRGERETLETCENVIRRGLDTFMEVGGALSVIRDQRLYRSSHKSFEEYCREKWDMTGRRARQLCAAAGVVRNLLEDRREEPEVSGLKSKVWKGTTEDAEHTEGGNGNGKEPVDELGLFAWRGMEAQADVDRVTEDLPKPTSERQVRPLAQLPREEQRAAYKEAVGEAKGKAPTTEQVERAVERHKPNKTYTPDVEPAQNRIEHILLTAQDTVVQIRRLQDLIDRTDTPMVKCCNAAVACIEELEVKFKKKREAGREKAQDAQKPTKKIKLSAAAKAAIVAATKARWAAVKKKNSRSAISNSQEPNGKGRFVVARHAGDHDVFMSGRGGWGERRRAQVFGTRSQAEAALGGRPGDIVRA